MRHGSGTFHLSGVYKYDGEWVDDVRHAKGKCVYYDGSTYDGDWKNDERKGLLFIVFCFSGNCDLWSFWKTLQHYCMAASGWSLRRGMVTGNLKAKKRIMKVIGDKITKKDLDTQSFQQAVGIKGNGRWDWNMDTGSVYILMGRLLE